MDQLYLNILELAMFFLLFPFVLKWFNALRYEEMFKKGHTKEIQILFIMSVIIFTYLFTTAIIRIIELSTSIIS